MTQREAGLVSGPAIGPRSMARAINTKSASIHTPFGLDGIFTFH
jgi:hypothetical protein